ncbi:hypothetical protein PILCRDRAFT_817917 [Piloderma croceum F 1598]|uniref:Uncharacterized protein n=1 Tax=Piloderma croceum (strain F 1598) TaxID=765440 RepID=A0A0C3C5Z6_PILCF|nr:hypothetical protein PILCRDRAFT_817917 [Piloderma croceum F 1598]
MKPLLGLSTLLSTGLSGKVECWSFLHKPSSVLNSIVTAPTQACAARGLDVWCLTNSERVDEAFANSGNSSFQVGAMFRFTTLVC